MTKVSNETSKWYEVIVDDFGSIENQVGFWRFKTVEEAADVALSYHTRHEDAKLVLREVVQEVTDTVLFGGSGATDNR